MFRGMVSMIRHNTHEYAYQHSSQHPIWKKSDGDKYSTSAIAMHACILAPSDCVRTFVVCLALIMVTSVTAMMVTAMARGVVPPTPLTII